MIATVLVIFHAAVGNHTFLPSRRFFFFFFFFFHLCETDPEMYLRTVMGALTHMAHMFALLVGTGGYLLSEIG